METKNELSMRDKKFHAACCAMTGLLQKYNLKTPDDKIVICQLSIELANELIKQLES